MTPEMESFKRDDPTLILAIVLIVIGVLALLVGVALDASTRRPR